MIVVVYRVVHRLRRLLRSRIGLIVAVFLVTWLLSASLFYYSEHVVAGRRDIDFWASLYWAIITMATVGYGDITPSRGLGWVVAGFAAVMGIAVYTLTISFIADEFMEASLRRSLGLAPLRGKEIVVIGGDEACRDLVDELVVNGLGGRVGWLVPERPVSEPPVDYVVGDPLKRDDLVKAGVPGARVVALCLGDDSRTLHAALAVRRLNRGARVVAVVRSGEAAELLRVAGVDYAVSSRLLGRALASAVFEPHVAWFIEEAVSARGVADVSEVEVTGDLAGLSVEEAEERLRRRGERVLVLGVVGRDGGIVLAPPRDRRLVEGERLLVLRVREGAGRAD